MRNSKIILLPYRVYLILLLMLSIYNLTYKLLRIKELHPGKLVDDSYVKCEFDMETHYPTKRTFTFEVSNN